MATSSNFLIAFEVNSNGDSTSPTPIVSVTKYAEPLNLDSTIIGLILSSQDLINQQIELQSNSFNSNTLTSFCSLIQSKVEQINSLYKSQSVSLSALGLYLLTLEFETNYSGTIEQITKVEQSQNSQEATDSLEILQVLISLLKRNFSTAMTSTEKRSSNITIETSPTVSKSVRTKEYFLKDVIGIVEDILKDVRILGKNETTLCTGISQLTSAITDRTVHHNRNSSLIANIRGQIANLQNQLLTAPSGSKLLIQSQISALYIELANLENTNDTCNNSTKKTTTSSRVNQIQSELDMLLASGTSPTESLTGKVTNYDSSLISTNFSALPITTGLPSNARIRRNHQNNSVTNVQKDGVCRSIDSLENLRNSLTIAYNSLVASGKVTTADSNDYFTKISQIESQLSSLRANLSSNTTTNAIFPLNLFQPASKNNSKTTTMNNPINIITESLGLSGTNLTKSEKDNLFNSLSNLSITEPYISIKTEESYEGLKSFMNISTTVVDANTILLKCTTCIDDNPISFSLPISVSTLTFLGSLYTSNLSKISSNELKILLDNSGFPHGVVVSSQEKWSFYVSKILAYICTSYIIFIYMDDKITELTMSNSIPYEQLLIPESISHMSNGSCPAFSSIVNYESSQVINFSCLGKLILLILSDVDYVNTITSCFGILTSIAN